jgi:hypothetical protein
MLVDRAWAQVDSSDEETDSEASDVEELPGPEEISQKTLDVEVEEDDLDYEDEAFEDSQEQEDYDDEEWQDSQEATASSKDFSQGQSQSQGVYSASQLTI